MSTNAYIVLLRKNAFVKTIYEVVIASSYLICYCSFMRQNAHLNL